MTRSLRALDWVNFFLADVLSGSGPFLGEIHGQAGTKQGAVCDENGVREHVGVIR